MKTKKILQRLYPEDAESDERVPRRRSWLRRWLSRRRWARSMRVLAALLLLGTLWGSVHIYYYNRLIKLEFDVQVAWAQVETPLQRRHHIQLNLTRMVLDYAAHEREVLTGITKLRTSVMQGAVAGPAATSQPVPPTPSAAAPDAGAPPPTPGGVPEQSLDQLTPAQIQELFAKILVVAEQYPELRLSENFKQFSKAMIDTETEIASRTTDYNAAVNVYGTELTQFPGNLFAWMFSFDKYDFYRPDESALKFRGVAY